MSIADLLSTQYTRRNAQGQGVATEGIGRDALSSLGNRRFVEATDDHIGSLQITQAMWKSCLEVTPDHFRSHQITAPNAGQIVDEVELLSVQLMLREVDPG